MKRISSILLLLFIAAYAYGDNVKVRLYSSNTIKSVNISVDLGHYNLYADRKSVV